MNHRLSHRSFAVFLGAAALLCAVLFPAQVSAVSVIAEAEHSHTNSIVQSGWGSGLPVVLPSGNKRAAGPNRRAPAPQASLSDNGSDLVASQGALKKAALCLRYDSIPAGIPSGRSPPLSTVTTL